MRTLPLLLAALLLAGCAAPSSTPPVATPIGEDGGAPPADTPESVAISLFEGPGIGVPPTTMGIRPGTLELALGTPYTLVIQNDGQLPHDLVIEGLGVDTDVFGPGSTMEANVTATEPGTYVMYCSVGGTGPNGHRAQGMEGEVIVA